MNKDLRSDASNLDLEEIGRELRGKGEFEPVFPGLQTTVPTDDCAAFPFIPLHEDMLRALEHVECVYRMNVVKDDEPSSTLKNLQRVIARAHAPAPTPTVAADAAAPSDRIAKFEADLLDAQDAASPDYPQPAAQPDDAEIACSSCGLTMAQSRALSAQPDERSASRAKVLEEAAAAVEQHDRKGREWVPGSLWDSIMREAAVRIRALAAAHPTEQHIDREGGSDAR